MKGRFKSALRTHENWVAASVFLSGLSLSLFINTIMVSRGLTSVSLDGAGGGAVAMAHGEAVWTSLPIGSHVMSSESAVSFLTVLAGFITSVTVTGLKVYKTVRQENRLQDLHELDVREREIEVAAMEVRDD